MSQVAARPKVAMHGAWQFGLSANSAIMFNVLLITACAAVMLLTLVAPPRRTGDAHQYLAMAQQLAELRLPALSPPEQQTYAEWLSSQPAASGFPDAARAIRQPALVREGNQEFSHFWFYSLLVAPALRLTGAVGVHPIAAFTAINAILLGASMWISSRVFGALASLTIIASPVVWFLGRAQVEVFTLTFLCLAMAAACRGRWGWAAIAVAIASTQNLPIAAMLPLFWAGAVFERLQGERSPRRPLLLDARYMWQGLALAFAGACIALVHPAYYLLRLGVVTPQQLNGGIAGAIPSLNQLLAPFIDPDIGFLAWLPVQVVLAVAGLALFVGSQRESGNVDQRQNMLMICASVMAIWFLFVFSQTTNVNSGGTVHISRYAIWFIPLALPAISVAARRIETQWPELALLVGVGVFLAYLGYFRPDQPERYVEHSPQATWLMSHVPVLYRPLPEVFAERTLHIDGGSRSSAATRDCQLILIVEKQPAQPCALTPTEGAAAAHLFAGQAEAVWIRRGVDTSISVGISRPQP